MHSLSLMQLPREMDVRFFLAIVAHYEGADTTGKHIAAAEVNLMMLHYKKEMNSKTVAKRQTVQVILTATLSSQH